MHGKTREIFLTRYGIWLLLAAGLGVRFIIFAWVDFMFDNDVRTFQLWGTQLATYGLSDFYTGSMWSDYPPGFLYILAAVGWLRLQSANFGAAQWELLSPVLNFFTLLPAMLADIGIGYVIWRVTRKNLFFPALWLFNPAVILISSVWGQVESVFLLPLVISLMFLRENKLLGAYMLYGVAIIIKPQALFLGPVYLFSAIAYRRVARVSLYIGAAVLGMLVLMFPFARGFDLIPVFRNMWGGLDMYNFGTVNAFNMWALAGRNWQPLDAMFLGISHGVWGVVIAVAIVLAVMAASAHDKSYRHFWLICAAVFILTFVFSVKMHERYMFPALLFTLLFATDVRRWYSYVLFGAVCTAFFVNCLAVLYAFNGGGNWWEAPALVNWMNPVSWLNIAIAVGVIIIFLLRIKKHDPIT
jgi:Gpi18-like mannosyltransferase